MSIGIKKYHPKHGSSSVACRSNMQDEPGAKRNKKDTLAVSVKRSVIDRSTSNAVVNVPISATSPPTKPSPELLVILMSTAKVTTLYVPIDA